MQDYLTALDLFYIQSCRHRQRVLLLLMQPKANMITRVTAQMHNMSQPQLMVLEDAKRDKCVTNRFSFILTYTSACSRDL